MGDANVRRPVATRFEHGVDFGLLVHKSPFMADKRDPLVLSNYIFELLEVNPGVAGFLIQLDTEDVDAVVESVTAHAEKGAGTKTTLYVGQEEEAEEVEEEEEDAGGVGAGGRKENPHNPLMISVQKVRIRPGKGKGKSDGWFPQPLTHNTLLFFSGYHLAAAPYLRQGRRPGSRGSRRSSRSSRGTARQAGGGPV